MKASQILLALLAVTLLGGAALVASNSAPLDSFASKSPKQGSATAISAQEENDKAERDLVDSMVRAAQAFLDKLAPELRGKTLLQFDDPMRLKWHYYPRVAWQRTGVMLKELPEDQKPLFFNLIRAGTSAMGFETTKNLMQLEAILRDIENTPFARTFRDPERFYLTIFGTPSSKGRWSWKIEGHHLLLNYVIDQGKIVSATPFVFGANPGRVPSGPSRGLRILPGQEDLGRVLFTSLSLEARDRTRMAEEPPFDVMTNADTRPKRLKKVGLRYRDMSAQQCKGLESILGVYTGMLPAVVQKRLLADIKSAGMDDICFAWSGSPFPGEPHYYQVNGPTFLIEFCNAQNGGNHIHLVWRNYRDDFGEAWARQE